MYQMGFMAVSSSYSERYSDPLGSRQWQHAARNNQSDRYLRIFLLMLTMLVDRPRGRHMDCSTWVLPQQQVAHDSFVFQDLTSSVNHLR